MVQRLIELESEATPHPWSESMLLSSLDAGAQCQLIESNGVRTGYYVLQRVLDEAEILNIVIFKAHQKQGLGHGTLSVLKSALQKNDTKTLFLEVRRSNTAARALYAAAGFQLMHIRSGYYRPRSKDQAAEDALLMRCELG